jgi:uncharacterized protein (TIGR03435 family)
VIDASGVTSSELTALVARALGQPVLDRTGLEGRVDAQVTWTADGPKPSSVAIALERQLGLKLVSIDTPDDLRRGTR